ncbi:MAG: hypothetical protein JRE40_12690, partial [Deltaproteobacteria bacterium]|nr:hypothetical protein [Deltaproteobacteria bacterium]
MTGETPNVDWSFSIPKHITEFIENRSYLAQDIAAKYKRKGDEKFIEAIAFSEVRDALRYPLDERREPATAFLWASHNKAPVSGIRKLLAKIREPCIPQEWEWKKTWPYVWRTMGITWLTKEGICIDTSIYLTSLLRTRESIKAYCACGYVTFEGDPNHYG